MRVTAIFGALKRTELAGVTREEESGSFTPFANGANGFGMTRYPTKAKCSDSDYVQR
jgi:hypothetical protein